MQRIHTDKTQAVSPLHPSTFCVPQLIRTSNNLTTAPTLKQGSGIKRVLKIAVEVNNFLFDSDKQPESLPPGSSVPLTQLVSFHVAFTSFHSHRHSPAHQPVAASRDLFYGT